MSTNEARPVRTLDDKLGFPRALIPVVVAVGIVFIFLTLPEFFRVVAGIDSSWSFLQSVLDKITPVLHRIDALSENDVKPVLEGSALDPVRRYGTMAALLAVPALCVAALVCSAKVWSWRPLLMTAAALFLGLLALPIAAAAVEAIAGLARLALWIVRMIDRFFAWASPVLAVLALIAGAVLAVALIVFLVKRIHRAHRWVTAALVLTGLATLWATASFGLFDDLIAWLGRLVADVGAWIARYLGPIFGWIVVALLVVAVVLCLLGAVVALFGHIGRTVVLPFGAAGKAGVEQAKCLDTAAGLGVALSMPLTAAVTNAEYRAEFLTLWHETPLINHLPPVVDGYDFLFRDGAERLLAYAFIEFNPTVDLALAFVVGVIAVTSLLFSRNRWSTEERAVVLSPVMIKVGVAIALAIPLLLLTMVVKASDD